MMKTKEEVWHHTNSHRAPCMPISASLHPHAFTARDMFLWIPHVNIHHRWLRIWADEWWQWLYLYVIFIDYKRGWNEERKKNVWNELIVRRIILRISLEFYFCMTLSSRKCIVEWTLTISTPLRWPDLEFFKFIFYFDLVSFTAKSIIDDRFVKSVKDWLDLLGSLFI